jgi:methionine-rich copper-binding protein CopC
MTIQDLGPPARTRRVLRNAAVVALVPFVAMFTVGMFTVGPGGSILNAPIASAHTALESSTPADGDVVTDLVDEIELVFTEPVELVGDGIQVLLPNEEISDVEAMTEDDITFLLEFDPPIGNGEVGVRFDVISADGHPVTGSFSFTIDDPTPEPTDPDPSDPETDDATTTTVAAATTLASTVPTTTPPTELVAAPDITVTIAEETSTPATEPVDDQEDNESGDDDDSNAATIVVVAILAALAAAIGSVFYVRKRGGNGEPAT